MSTYLNQPIIPLPNYVIRSILNLSLSISKSQHPATFNKKDIKILYLSLMLVSKEWKNQIVPLLDFPTCVIQKSNDLRLYLNNYNDKPNIKIYLMLSTFLCDEFALLNDNEKDIIFSRVEHLTISNSFNDNLVKVESLLHKFINIKVLELNNPLILTKKFKDIKDKQQQQQLVNNSNNNSNIFGDSIQKIITRSIFNLNIFNDCIKDGFLNNLKELNLINVSNNGSGSISITGFHQSNIMYKIEKLFIYTVQYDKSSLTRFFNNIKNNSNNTDNNSNSNNNNNNSQVNDDQDFKNTNIKLKNLSIVKCPTKSNISDLLESMSDFSNLNLFQFVSPNDDVNLSYLLEFLSGNLLLNKFKLDGNLVDDTIQNPKVIQSPLPVSKIQYLSLQIPNFVLCSKIFEHVAFNHLESLSITFTEVTPPIDHTINHIVRSLSSTLLKLTLKSSQRSFSHDKSIWELFFATIQSTNSKLTNLILQCFEIPGDILLNFLQYNHPTLQRLDIDARLPDDNQIDPASLVDPICNNTHLVALNLSLTYPNSCNFKFQEFANLYLLILENNNTIQHLDFSLDSGMMISEKKKGVNIDRAIRAIQNNNSLISLNSGHIFDKFTDGYPKLEKAMSKLIPFYYPPDNESFK
ncbi:hypothetical protein CYY_007608 [Polysphondylium violaceum]|uniref:Uncharacterized protein n=1 Tax=Polysphondylium violaceum TaxID=133409 RepID=A0A8J4UQS4_9MYCE|nr:hypothetical protein CYY_007608 [Polysphondylium violaceum]